MFAAEDFRPGVAIDQGRAVTRVKPSKEVHIERLTSQLADEYAGRVDADEVAEVVRSEYERLCAESKVTEFVPILAERRVRRLLRKRWGGDRRAAGPSPEQLAG